MQKSISFLLTFLIFISPFYSYSDIVPDPQKLFGISIDQVFDQDNISEEQKKEIVEKFKVQSLTIGLEIYGLIYLLKEKMDRLEKTKGFEAILKEVIENPRNNEIRVEIPNVGKAELTASRDRVKLKVVHYKTESVHVFKDINHFAAEIQDKNADPKINYHRRKVLAAAKEYTALARTLSERSGINYIELFDQARNIDEARALSQQIQTETEISPEELEKLNQSKRAFWNRVLDLHANHKKDQHGRDFYEHIYSKQGLIESSFKPRITKYDSWDSLKAWMDANFVKPDFYNSYYWKENGLLALVKGDLLVMEASALFQLGVGMLFNPSYAIVSVMFSLVIGAHAATYTKLMTNSRTEGSRAIKQFVISMAFSETFLFLEHGIRMFDIFSPEILLMHLSFIAINYAVNISKSKSFTMVRYRKLADRIEGTLKIGKYETEIPLDNYQGQRGSNFHWLLKTSDFTIFGFPLITILANPYYDLTNFLAAKRENLPKAEAELKAQWEKGKAFGIPYLGSIGRGSAKLLTSAAVFGLKLLPLDQRLEIYRISMATAFSTLLHLELSKESFTKFQERIHQDIRIYRQNRAQDIEIIRGLAKSKYLDFLERARERQGVLLEAPFMMKENYREASLDFEEREGRDLTNELIRALRLSLIQRDYQEVLQDFREKVQKAVRDTRQFVANTRTQMQSSISSYHSQEQSRLGVLPILDANSRTRSLSRSRCEAAFL